MRPKFLKIEGLNSFIEMQKIDFTLLNQRGLFGVFGPTGSGKSSILDAMILALYGEIPRGTREFVNTVKNKSYVSFEFDTKNGEKRDVYRVDRAFRRDKKGSIKADFARIYAIKGSDEEEVIAEGVKDVREKVIEIIGLQKEDFMRSVILPQGKFSDFLKLQDGSRNEMMERMLRLGKYGTKLYESLKIKRIENEKELAALTGERSSHKDVSEEMLEELNKEHEEIVKSIKNIKDKIDRLSKEYSEDVKVLELQKSLKAYEAEKKALDDHVEEINLNKLEIRNAQKAMPIWDKISDWMKLESEIESANVKLVGLKEKLEIEKIALKESTEKHEKALEIKNSQLEKLSVKEHEAKEAVEISKNVVEIERELKELLKSKESLGEEAKICNQKIVVLEGKIQDVTKALDEMDRSKDKYKVTPEYSQKIDEGVYLEKQSKENEKVLKELSEDIIGYKKQIDVSEKNLAGFTAQLKDKRKLEKQIIDEVKQLQEAPPKKQEEIIELKSTIDRLKNEIVQAQQIMKEIEGYSKKVADKNKENKELKGKLALLSKENDAVEKSIKELEDKKNKQRELVYARELAGGLINGEACPVCGSTHHPNVHTEDVAIDEKIDANINELSKKKDKLSTDLITVKLKIENNEQGIKETEESIKQKSELLPKKDIDELKSEGKAIKEIYNESVKYYNKYTQQLENLKDKEKSLVEEINEYDKKIEGISAKNEQYKELLKKEEKKKNTLIEKQEKITEKITLLKDSINNEKLINKNLNNTNLSDVSNGNNENKKIDSFVAEKSRLYENEKKLKMIEEDIKKYTVSHKECMIKLDELKEKKSKNEIKVQENKNYINQKEKDKIECDLKIKNICGELSPTVLLKNTSKAKEKIIDDERITRENNDKVTQIVNKLRDSLSSIETLLSDKKDSYINKKSNIDEIMKDSGFIDVKQVKLSIKTKEELTKLEEKVTAFDDRYSAVNNNIDRVNKLLGDKRVDENVIKEKEVCIGESKTEFDQLNEQKGSKEHSIKSMKQDLKEVEEINKKIKEKEHTQDMLKELQSLIKGKNFVKYVSKSHLAYIVKEASKNIMSITNNRYSLELDSDNGFIICDNYNGGVRRSCKTLSGGETFIASLCLALALSSHIQLRGSASLEFFFLDEGFGTLDENSLDLVMTALEKLRGQNLCVGIISHVSELKNRLPIKVIVEPAKAGISGSKLKIEL